MNEYESVFARDDVGKAVVDGDGNSLGLVSSVNGGTAYVDPEPDISTRIRTVLGWEHTRPGDRSYPLEESAVARVTDRRIRVRLDG